MNAVSRYGPAVVRDSTGARQFLGRAEAELIVLALDAAADAAGHSADRQPIDSLARQYTKLRDGWSGTRASYLEAILAGTGRLQSVCGS
jgi:hypothetical protein